MFKNLKIAVRLGLVLGLLAALMAAIAVVGNLGMGRINYASEDIVANKWPKVLLLQQGLAGVNEIAIGARDIVLADTRDAVQRSRARILDGRASIGKAWETLGPGLTHAKGKEFFRLILETRQKYIAAQDQIIALAEQGKLAEAKLVLNNELQPVALEYRKRVNDLVDFQGELMNEAGRTAATEYRNASATMAITGLAALVFSVGLGWPVAI
ncbi:MAG: MCP four helix bundle domain-containing protein [Rhodocyclales bacterium]|nr:MCP four helix bundle domain-containing protein [Rhodocyclales bacterium]